MSLFRSKSLYVIASLFFIVACSKDCEEPEEPYIAFSPHILPDSVKIWVGFDSPYIKDDIGLNLTEGDSLVRLALSGPDIVVSPFGEYIYVTGEEFNGSVNIIDRIEDTIITSARFESILEGGNPSDPCSNPLIQTIRLFQDNQLLYEGGISPVPSIYLNP